MTYPSRRYHKSWVTQRMLNNFAEFAEARTNPVSVANQLLNYQGVLIEETLQKLLEERNNEHLSTTNTELLNHLYLAELPFGFNFTQVDEVDGSYHYTPPTVYAMINGSEVEIDQAEENNIQTLYYESLPTRVEYDERQILWSDIIPQTQVDQIINLTPNSMPINGHLYITLEDNTIWQQEFKNKLYFSKVFISGTSRKGTEIEEVVPLRLNATFQTVNQWKEISEIYVSHLASDAKITVSCLPFAENPILDPLNLSVPVEGGDRYQFIKLESESFGSVLVAESYINEDLDIVRMNIDEKREDYSLELLDENGLNVNINGFMLKPNSQYIYAIDNYYFYVYDRRLPYPEITNITGQSADTRIILTTPDYKWVYTKNSVATVTTRTIDLWSSPFKFRWSILVPDGTEYRVDSSGNYSSINNSGWIDNLLYEGNGWDEHEQEFTLDQSGEYIITFEAQYEEDGSIVSRVSKSILYVPAIRPETQLALPVSLRGCLDLSIDSDGTMWFYNGTSIYRVKIYHDYFAVDYKNKRIWLNEQYNSIRVLP